MFNIYRTLFFNFEKGSIGQNLFLNFLIEKSFWNDIFTSKILPIIREKHIFFIWTQRKSTWKQQKLGENAEKMNPDMNPYISTSIMIKTRANSVKTVIERVIGSGWKFLFW